MSRPSPNFDRLASIYRWMELFSFGPYLARCRFAYLDRFAGRQRGLILGDGDGRFTAQLLQTNSAIRVDAIDISPAMLRALTHRAGQNSDRIHAAVADLRTWQPCPAHHGDGLAVGPYDLVATHFFLDCLSTGEVSTLAEKLRPSLAPNALWAISEFAIPSGWFGQLCARPLIGLLYWAFKVLTGLTIRHLPDHKLALQAAGFKRIGQQTFLRGLLVSELWALQSRLGSLPE